VLAILLAALRDLQFPLCPTWVQKRPWVACQLTVRFAQSGHSWTIYDYTP